MEPEGS